MKQVIIKVCGSDRCGKTQIIKELSHRLGVPSFKASSEHESYLSSKVTKRQLFLNQLRYADPQIFDFLKQTGYSALFDRGFPCEYAYSRVFNRETDLNMLRHLDEMWASLDTLVVWCQRSSYVGIADDLDPTIQEEKLQQIHDAYADFASWTRCRVLRLNVDDENLDREVKEIIAALQNS